MCKLCLQVYKHMCVSTHVCSCMWRAGANVNHLLLPLHLVHRGKASQSNLEHAIMSSSNSQLALGIHCSHLWRLELHVGLCTYLTVYMASGDHKCSLTLMQQACKPLSHLPRLYSSSQLRNYSASLNLHFSICKMEGCSETSSQRYAGVLSKLIHIPNTLPCLVNWTYYYLVQNPACVLSSS